MHGESKSSFLKESQATIRCEFPKCTRERVPSHRHGALPSTGLLPWRHGVHRRASFVSEAWNPLRSPAQHLLDRERAQARDREKGPNRARQLRDRRSIGESAVSGKHRVGWEWSLSRGREPPVSRRPDDLFPRFFSLGHRVETATRRKRPRNTLNYRSSLNYFPLIVGPGTAHGRAIISPRSRRGNCGNKRPSYVRVSFLLSFLALARSAFCVSCLSGCFCNGSACDTVSRWQAYGVPCRESSERKEREERKRLEEGWTGLRARDRERERERAMYAGKW